MACRHACQGSKEHAFLIWEPFEGPTLTLTYGAFYDAVGRLASGFIQHGIKPGEFVLIHLKNCLESILTWYACATCRTNQTP